MSRSGYSEDHDNWELTKWRGRVESAARGKRGQKFFLDLVTGLDAMPEKKLLKNVLQCADGMCALGVVGAKRGIDLSPFNPDDSDDDSEDCYKTECVGDALDISEVLARETTFINDEGTWQEETPEQRWKRVRDWAVGRIKPVFESEAP